MSAVKPWTIEEVKAIGLDWGYREKALATVRERNDLRAALQQAFQYLPDDVVKEMSDERDLAFGKEPDDE